MAKQKDVPAEKQLLHLIEGQDAKQNLRSATIKYQGMSIFSFGALKGRMGFLRSRFAGLMNLKDLRQFDIKAVNEILKICVFILAAYFAASTAFSVAHLKKEITLKVSVEKPGEGTIQKQLTSLLKSGSYYLEKARARDIFSMGLKKPAEAKRGPSQKLLEAVQNLRLVGISWSYDPDVMIEDTKTQKTFFLKKGQRISGGVKLESVFKDKVILSYEGEEIELR